MARVRDVPIEEVPERLRPVFRAFCGEHGNFANQVAVLAHRPPVLEHLMGLLLALASENVVERRHRELVVVTVSKLNECRYCVAHHAPVLVHEGIAPETVSRILEPDCPGLDGADRAVRDLAVAVTEHPGRIPDRLFDRLREHFDEARIVELTVRIALTGLFNRVNEALQIDMEPGVIESLLASGARESDLPAR